MSYIVVFPDADGGEQVELCPTIDAATARAEELRNRRGIADVRLGRVEPIAFTFAPQYRVSLDDERIDRPTRSEQPVARPEPVAPAQPPMPAATSAPITPTRVQPGELTAAEIAEMVALDEAHADLAGDDTVRSEVLRRHADRTERQRGLFGR